MIKAKLSYFFHPVNDLKSALTFFRDILGLELLYNKITNLSEEQTKSDDALANLQWLEFDAGGVTMLVQKVPGIKPYETGIGFQVNNCDEAFVFFRNNDVKITRPIQGEGNNRSFDITDPDGSTFTIFGA